MKNLLLLFLLSFSGISFAQTTGMILEPATGVSAGILDPNSDGYVSSTTAGFLGNDQINNELPWQTLIPAGSEPNSDVQNGPNCGFTDFVESTVGGIDPVFHLSSGANWLFRFRMAGINPNAKSYSILVDIDNLIGPSDDCYIAGVNPGFELEIVLATKFGVRIYDHRLPCGSNLVASYGPERIQKSIAASNVCSSMNFFLEMYVDWADITAQFGVNENTAMRYAIVDNMAADKSTICNPASASDIGGVDDNACGNLEACFTEIILLQPGCAPSAPAACTFSDCPTINGVPLSVGATSVSLTTTETSGVLRIYSNGSLIGSQAINTGAGTYSVTVSPALAANANITATAQATGEVESGTNCNNVQIAGATCTDPPTNVNQCNARKAFSGTAPAGSIVRLYDSNGVLQIPSSGTLFTAGTGGNPNTVTASGIGLLAPENFLWRCVGSGETNSCTAGGGPCIAPGNYYITAQLPGQCESSPVWFCLGLTGSTSVPNISTAITSATLTVTGNLAGNLADNNGVSIYLYVNSGLVGTTTTTTNTGNWTINIPAGTFSPCDEVYVVAARNIATALCPSQSAVSIVSGGASAAPVIDQPICGLATSVSGTSTEANGSTVTLYQGTGTATVLGTTTVSGGSWSITGLSIAPGTTITARTTNTVLCEGQSVASASVIIGSLYTNPATISPNPVTESDMSVSGTGTPGDVITLYNDGWPVYLNFVESVQATAIVNESGNWTITLIDAGIFYAGGTLTVTSSSGSGCTSLPQDPTPIVCTPPNSSLVVNPDAVTICSGTPVIGVVIQGSQFGVIYQLYNNVLAANSGGSVLGNGGNITLTSASISANTIISVLAIKSPYNGSCNNTLTENIIVNVVAPPTLVYNSQSNPITCNGSDGSITISGLANNQTYTVNYTDDGTSVSGSFTSNGSGQLIIAGLNAGSYANFSTTGLGCNSANTLAGAFILENPPIPPAPVVACFETATYNNTTCSWDVTGTQPAAPTGLACYESANFNNTTCSWDVTGTQPTAPTGLACYESSNFNTTTCSWDVTGTQPTAPTGLACYESANFNNTT
ncbi:MAG: hypothetical protein K9G40_13365, partial [Crocinitomicaceae bacterium]|nr:hypothetical protein [Crocinitomicaceae bacterium]